MLVGGDNVGNGVELRQLLHVWIGVVQDAVVFARKQGNVDGDRIALVGFSLGSYVALSAAVTEEKLRVSAVVEFFGGLPRELHPKVGPMPPVLIVHGDKDSIMPINGAHDLPFTFNCN